jgi:DNA-directed RNA polymerase specialized sigma24 family protein
VAGYLDHARGAEDHFRMTGRSRQDQDRLPEFYLSPSVKGQSIDSEVRVAFEHLWPWFWRYVRSQLSDSHRAGDLAEEVAYRVSSFVTNHPGQVRSMVGLCRAAAKNFVLTERAKERRVEYRGLDRDIATSIGVPAADSHREIEVWILIDQLLHGRDLDIRRMLQLRMLGETWGHIGGVLGLTEGQARLRFKRAVEEICESTGFGRPERGRK